ncbi:Thymus-specific serine protease, partial [Leucoagaricus sp. SymC.cos]
WVNSRHYSAREGVPVLLLDGGPVMDAEEQLSVLDTGIADIFAKATGGLAILLEHRYYGTSQRMLFGEYSSPSSLSLGILNLIAGSTMTDNVRFMTHFRLDDTGQNLTAGLYAGARAAHMRIQFPGLVYDAISSSAITYATLENWRYNEVVSEAAGSKSADSLEKATKAIYELIDGGIKRQRLKNVFGLADLKHDDDFAALILRMKSKSTTSNEFERFCSKLTAPYGNLTDAVISGLDTATQCNIRRKLNDARRIAILDHPFQISPPEFDHPRIISCSINLEYQLKICRRSFLSGKHYRAPNITSVNALGYHDVATDRLAFIDGEYQWRPLTSHSDQAEVRPDTILRPFNVVPNVVHLWDMHGLAKWMAEPPEIRGIHEEIIHIVREWIKAWPIAGIPVPQKIQ